MFKLLTASALLTLSAAAGAQSLSDTHERVSAPGKTFSHYRPIKHTAPVTATCHPEASKGRACVAIARSRAAERAALAAAASKPIEVATTAQ
jgi:acyl-coenzyme A thioesterase PaaI-like protein